MRYKWKVVLGDCFGKRIEYTKVASNLAEVFTDYYSDMGRVGTGIHPKEALISITQIEVAPEKEITRDEKLDAIIRRIESGYSLVTRPLKFGRNQYGKVYLEMVD